MNGRAGEEGESRVGNCVKSDGRADEEEERMAAQREQSTASSV